MNYFVGVKGVKVLVILDYVVMIFFIFKIVLGELVLVYLLIKDVLVEINVEVIVEVIKFFL